MVDTTKQDENPIAELSASVAHVQLERPLHPPLNMARNCGRRKHKLDAPQVHPVVVGVDKVKIAEHMQPPFSIERRRTLSRGLRFASMGRLQ